MARDRIEGNIHDLEGQKFEETDAGQVAVRTLVDGSIESAPVGLSKDFLVTTFIVGDTETKLPPTPLLDRNFMVLINQSETETIYIGKTGVTSGNAIGSSSGMDVPPSETFNIAIKGNVEVQLYAITESGKTAKVKVVEVS